MNKLLNWVFGSFFRTLGRLIAIFCVGILLLFIGSKIGLRFPKNIFMKVNAATTDGKYISSMAPNENLTNKYNFDYNKGGFYTEFYNNYENKNWYFSPISFENNIYNNVYVPITISDPNSILSITKNQNGPDIIKELGASISVRAIWNEGWLSWCYSTEISKNNNSVIYKCNVPNTRTSLKGLNVHIADTSTGADILDSVVTVGVSDTFDFEISSNKTNEDIKNSTNDIKNSTNDIKDSINNSNVDDSSSTASGFFDNFSDNDHGLSSIITAPLRAINSMLSNQCVAPGATYKGQSFSLPCGSMLWDRPGGNDFKNFINIFYGGFLAYFVIRRLFLDIEKLKNPNNDKVEVEKL